MDGDQFLTVVDESPGFVRISVSGPSTAARLHRALDRVVAESATRGVTRVLVDAREVPPPIPTSDKFDLGVAAGHALGSRIKLAVLGTPATVDHFFATVARSRGAIVLAFIDESAAVKWLTGS
jgi:hypothetical protein